MMGGDSLSSSIMEGTATSNLLTTLSKVIMNSSVEQEESDLFAEASKQQSLH